MVSIPTYIGRYIVYHDIYISTVYVPTYIQVISEEGVTDIIRFYILNGNIGEDPVLCTTY